ncbi:MULTISPECIES: hypothetical protein [unclassified Paenibacillus]|uniref:hypothetical protein n=1 Tax=unclassified Paenibacillus TaxID=185978 RepID=UPI00277EB1B4|nr:MULTISPECIES: hypothetical protein [unclassified Paenibacillus]MDQ0896354.1 hypothetical protein [Paenibacillus sp. V4I7]MDQ0914103.1 hypothetical protein [Paenibacillus sp. V4I5]
MSIERIKRFIEEGNYQELKIAEARVDRIQEILRESQMADGSSRMEWKDAGVVGKIMRYNVYQTNHIGLNEHLLDLGILPVIADVDIKDLDEVQIKALKRYLVPGEPYVQFHPKKASRVDVSFVESEVSWLRDASFSDQANAWRAAKGRLHVAENLYQNARAAALKCPNLQKERKLQYDFGSFSYLEKKATCDPEAVLSLFGDAVLIQCARVDSGSLEECCARGYLHRPEVNQFRKIVDVQQRYVVMEIEKEKQNQDFLNRRLKRLSILSQNQSMA